MATSIADHRIVQKPFQNTFADGIAVKMAKNNIPFQNLWATSWLTDYLIWHRLQEWVRPGYLRRR